MRSTSAASVLKVTKATLTKYINEGKIKAVKLPNGRYDIDEKSVYRFLDAKARKKRAKVRAAAKRVEAMTHQPVVEEVVTPVVDETPVSKLGVLKDFCNANGLVISGVFVEGSGADPANKQKIYIDL